MEEIKFCIWDCSLNNAFTMVTYLSKGFIFLFRSSGILSANFCTSLVSYVAGAMLLELCCWSYAVGAMLLELCC